MALSWHDSLSKTILQDTFRVGDAVLGSKKKKKSWMDRVS